jgi:hypothetical protein
VSDLASAKRKLAENRAAAEGDVKHRLTQREIDAIMAENERRAQLGSKKKDERGYFGRYRNGQSTDHMND